MKKILKRIGMFAMVASVCFMAFSTSITAQAASVSELREKVVSVAQGEIGYYPAVHYQTKYGTWYGYQGAWCTTFSIWCFDQADKAMGTKMYTNIVPSGGSCQSMKQWFISKGTYKSRTSGYVPQPGDMVIFDADGDGSSEHVGIVENSDGATVNTIEGNVAKKNGISGVARRSYKISSVKIMGYGSPNYSAYGSSDSGTGNVPTPTPPPSNGNSVVQIGPDTVIEAYQATVNTSNLNVRNTPSTNGSVVKQIKSGASVTVTATNGSWSRIQDGYVMSQYLTKAGAVPTPQPVEVAPVNQSLKSIRLSAETDKLTVGQSVMLNAEIKPNGASGNLVFSADNGNVTVDQSGNVTAVSAGEAVVTVSATDTSVSTKYTFFIAETSAIESTESSSTSSSENDAQNQNVDVAETSTTTPSTATIEETHRRNALANKNIATAKQEEQKKSDKRQTFAFIGTGVGAVGIASIVPVLFKRKKSIKLDEEISNESK